MVRKIIQTSINPVRLHDKDTYLYNGKHRVISQKHYAYGKYSLGGADDAIFAVKYNMDVTHHSRWGGLKTIFTPNDTNINSYILANPITYTDQMRWLYNVGKIFRLKP